jgi:hypothetical protein
MRSQNVGEYRGLLDGGSTQIETGLRDIVQTIEDALRDPTPMTWLGIGAFFFVLWFIFIRRRR